MAALSKYTYCLSQPVPGGEEGVVFLMKDAINTTYLTKAEYTHTHNPAHIHTQTANKQRSEFKDFNLSHTLVFSIMGRSVYTFFYITLSFNIYKVLFIKNISYPVSHIRCGSKVISHTQSLMQPHHHNHIETTLTHTSFQTASHLKHLFISAS